MGKRDLRFHCGFIIHEYVLALPGILLCLPTLKICPSEERHGIRIVDPTPNTLSRFASIVEQALDLISASDSVRFRRVRIQIRTISNASGIVGPAYMPALKASAVNLRSLACQRDMAGGVRFLASLLVHNATVGYLLRQGCLRTRRNYDRFDRICAREAQRFMQRLGMARTPWDPENLSRLPLKEGLKFLWEDFVAAEKEASQASHDKTNQV